METKVKVKTNSLAKVAVTAAAMILLVGGAVAVSRLNLKKVIYVGGNSVKVEMAETSDEIAKGLSGRSDLGKNEGMLFAYPNYLIPSFWMKGMEFGLDIIWIRDDMVYGFEKNVQPQPLGEELTVYQPESFINYALEVPAGFVDLNGIKIGDKVEL